MRTQQEESLSSMTPELGPQWDTESANSANSDPGLPDLQNYENEFPISESPSL